MENIEVLLEHLDGMWGAAQMYCGDDAYGDGYRAIRAALVESTNSSHNKASAPCKWQCSCGQEVVGDYCKCGAYRCDL